MKNISTLSAFAFLSLLVIFSQCKPNSGNNSANSINSKIYNEGLAIVSQNCVSCHSPKEELENRIAPPLVAVKEHYMKKGIEESEFINKMSDFLQSPNILNSKMPKAVEKFGLMPGLPYSKEQFQAAATYIYRADFEKPEWFAKHYQKEKEELFKNTDKDDEDYTKQGLNTVILSQFILAKNLKSAIQQNGTTGAIEFCNDKATFLTDSLTAALNVNIKRVSDKNRNSANTANSNEIEYIRQAKLEIQDKGSTSPKVFEQNDKMLGYYPIMTNSLCLQCHGNPNKDIESNTLEIIQSKYPGDMATGYGVNELRGIWVIEMEK